MVFFSQLAPGMNFQAMTFIAFLDGCGWTFKGLIMRELFLKPEVVIIVPVLNVC